MEGGKRRSFSIASPPHDSEFIELHVRKVAGGGFTERLFGGGTGTEALRVGSLLRIEGPVGQFSYRAGSGPVIMVAGGTGFAPLKSMLRHALETGSERRIHLYWGARHLQDVYEHERVLDWVRRYPHLSFTVVLSEAAGAEASHTRTGWVHEAVLQDYPDLTGFEVYAAGPPAMIEAIRAGFQPHGLDPARLYFDSFDYAPDSRRASIPGK
jgi:CDP-4-dehydro-6-deoxyglucose reductase